MKLNRLLLLFCLGFSANYATAQFCDDNRFTNAEYFSNTQTDSLMNVVYGNAVNFDGDSQDLDMDFYFPKKSEDAMTKRPFVLFIHGGGFFGGNKSDFKIHSKAFAKRGYVAATMSYRLKFDQNLPGDNVKAVYRAQQDASAALRYVTQFADSLGIDTSSIFIGGSSAGAITSLCVAYVSQQEWLAVFNDIESTLGPLNTSGNDYANTYSIKGIYNFMGAVPPAVLNPEDFVPTISFHGEKDEMVNIDISPMTGAGSRVIHQMLSEQGVCNDLTIVPDGGHGILRSPEDLQFRINRVACFFKSLLCDSCNSFKARENVPASCAE